MIDITRLYYGHETEGDGIRYGRLSGSGMPSGYPNLEEHPKSADERRPVVVWNVTRACNLSCIHCYSDSDPHKHSDELTTEEGLNVIDDLADFRVPVLLLSGGEPLIRPDLFELAEYAVNKGIRVVISTNGTLITKNIAEKIRCTGISYVGISFDGIREVNDRFRGKKGAFDLALKGLRNCLGVGQKVGLRLTLTRYNFDNLDEIFAFIEEEGIPRACFYHLVYTGRGRGIREFDLGHEDTREALDLIVENTGELLSRGIFVNVLTVDNHVDGPYIYMKLKKKDPLRAEEMLKFMLWNGGGNYSSGVAIGCIDFKGDIHPDQFWVNQTLGNVRDRRFSEVWTDCSNPLMAGLKKRKGLLKGRCATCRWVDCCGGGFRVRADFLTGDPWEEDPACYLSDEEIRVQMI